MQPPFLLLFFLFCLLSLCFGHESCCKYKLQEQHQEPEFIEDPNEIPPAVWQGQSLYIDDPNDQKPDDWDVEDDGEWKPARILNTDFTWHPTLIRNPLYVPPPTYFDKLKVEVSAAIPWVTLGVLITGALSTFPLASEKIGGWLFYSSRAPTNFLVTFIREIYQYIFVALLGLATPLCSCGSLPLCASLLKEGVPFSSVLVFLTASQSAGLDSAAITFGLLGAQAMIGRLVGAVALALAIGLASAKSQSRLPSKRQQSDRRKVTNQDDSSTLLSFGAIISICLEIATEIYPTVFMGLVLSTAALHYLPSLTSYISSEGEGASDLWMRMGLLVSAIPLQLCEHTSVALASAVQKAGGSPGLAFAFLLSAPATNLTTIIWMTKATKMPQVLLILGALACTSLGLSYLVDGWELDLLAGKSVGDMPDLPHWFMETSPYISGMMLTSGFYKKYSKRPSLSQPCSDGMCCASGSDKTKMD